MDKLTRILIAEDEPTIAEVVSRYLERAGYATEIVSAGAVVRRS